MSSPSDTSPSSSPHSFSGGTTFIHPDSSHNNNSQLSLQELIPSEQQYTCPIDQFLVSSASNDQLLVGKQVSSTLSSGSFKNIQFTSTPLQSISENLSNLDIDSSSNSPEAICEKSCFRERESSAPLPSVPPTTPASSSNHRTPHSQPIQPINSPSTRRHDSPPTSAQAAALSSPLTENSVSEHGSETSDSNSIEIISGYGDNSFGSGIQGLFRSRKSSVSRSSSSNSGILTTEAVDLAHHLINVGVTPDTSSQVSRQTLPSDPRFLEIHDNLKGSNYSVISNPLITLSNHQDDIHLEGNLLRSSIPLTVDLPQQQFEDLRENKVTSDTNATHDGAEILRTPNVYINGLPPHFPDENLFLMTREFGHVLSVRTFTRCVGEKMSGYGFVLFDSVDSAERCIETLRKYRNLHPSFSKQVHKIPGTPYASGTITLPHSESESSVSSQPSFSAMNSFPSTASTLAPSLSTSALSTTSSSSKGGAQYITRNVSMESVSDPSTKEVRELTFREKMERLKDNRSTNLYMEGLPLTIDDIASSLAALVSPHKVVSSRFFQTKLSNPPRMIAFVRLDTRTGAEEIIERLHGRVVRGWNDNGCRISVRFADTNEQRELRRTERSARGEDEENGGGTRLSMAQAALLNLRGAEAQAHLGYSITQKDNIIQGSTILPSTKSFPNGHSTTNSYHPLTTHQQTLINSGIHEKPHLTNYKTTPSWPQRSCILNTSTSVGSKSENIYVREGKNDSMMVASMLPSELHHRSNDQDISTKQYDLNQLAFIHQQNQLRQLHLIQQMQNMACQDIDPNFNLAINNCVLQSQGLMPSANIFNGGRDLNLDTCPSNHLLKNGRQTTASNAQQHVPAFNGVPDRVTDIVHHPSNEPFVGIGRCSVDSDQQSFVTNHKSTSSSQSLSFSRLGVGLPRDENVNTDHRRRASALDEGEITLISPALTYASRTPSTLSPATPLFNTFGTPASAPATVPRGKTSVRERDFFRPYKNETRQ